MSGPVLPGVIRQIGYIVQDFDKAIATWLELGVGPFYVLRSVTQTGVYRGEECTVTLTIGFANSGDLQIEVIHQDNDAPSIYSEFTSAGGDGFISWRTGPTTSTPHWRRVRLPAGRWCGPAGMTAWPGTAYFSRRPGTAATIIELMELTPATTGWGN